MKNSKKKTKAGYMITLAVELEYDQVKLIIRTLQEKSDDIQSATKNPEGLSDEFVHEQQLEMRNLNDVIRELKHFTTEKKKKVQVKRHSAKTIAERLHDLDRQRAESKK